MPDLTQTESFGVVDDAGFVAEPGRHQPDRGACDGSHSNLNRGREISRYYEPSGAIRTGMRGTVTYVRVVDAEAVVPLPDAGFGGLSAPRTQSG